MLVEDAIVLELKSAQSIEPIHEAQLLTYLSLPTSAWGFC